MNIEALEKLVMDMNETIVKLRADQWGRALRGHYRVDGIEVGESYERVPFTVECLPASATRVRLLIHKISSAAVMLSPAQARKIGQGLIVAANEAEFPNQRGVA
jgi:hypothetical protein